MLTLSTNPGSLRWLADCARLDMLQTAAPDDAGLARGIAMAIGTASDGAAPGSEKALRQAWRLFRKQRVFWS
jgi:hypothetical protein